MGSGAAEEGWCARSLLRPAVESGPRSLALCPWQGAVQQDASRVLLETSLHVNFYFCPYKFFFWLSRSLEKFFGEGLIRESLKGTTARGKL